MINPTFFPYKVKKTENLVGLRDIKTYFIKV
jgi:hypothetical protein